MEYSRNTYYTITDGKLKIITGDEDYKTPIINIGVHRITLLQFLSKLNFFDYEIYNQKNELIYFRNTDIDLFSNIKELQVYHDCDVITSFIHNGVFRIFIFIEENFI